MITGLVAALVVVGAAIPQSAAAASMAQQSLKPAAVTADPLTATVTYSPTGTVAAKGGTVKFTYSVLNNTNSPAYYRSVLDDGCRSPSYATGAGSRDGMQTDGTRWWIPAKGTAVFSCSTVVTTDLTSKLKATFDVSSAAGATPTPFTATKDTTVDVANQCTALYYASTTYKGAAGTYGTFATSGTPAMTSKGKIGDLESGKDYPDSAAFAVDPTQPTVAYYIPRRSDGTEIGLWKLNLSAGTSARVTPAGPATETVRLAVGRDGTVWTWAYDNVVYSLASGSTTWKTHSIVESKGVNGGSVDVSGIASGDIVVDGNGNLWLLAASSDGYAALLTVPAAQTSLADYRATAIGQWDAPEGAFYSGAAFGADGFLYASAVPDGSATSATVNALYRLDPSKSGPTNQTKVTSSASTSLGSVGDLGSCAMPRSQLRLLKTASTPTPAVKSGDTITYTLQVDNLGNLASLDAELKDTIPANTTYVPNTTTLNGSAVADSDGKMPYASAREIHAKSANPGVIPGGEKATISFSVKVNNQIGSSVQTIQNDATVTDSSGPIDSDDPGVPGSLDSTEVPFSRTAVAITKSASTSQVTGSGNVTYTFVVTNTGPDPLVSVRVRDVLTENRSGTPKAPTTDSCADPALRAGSDANGNGKLDPSEPWTYTCTQSVAWKSGDPPIWQVADTGTVTATGSVTGVGVSASASASVDVVPTPANIDVSKSAGTIGSPDPATGVMQAKYTVRVSNGGQVAGSYGVLTDTPSFATGLKPVGARFQRPDGGTGTWDGTGGSFALTTGTTSIAANTVQEYAVTIDVMWTSTSAAACSSSPGPGKGLFNSVSLTTGQKDNESNNSACIEPPPPPVTKIEVTKSAPDGVVDSNADGTTSAGDGISYTFTVKNAGTLPLSSVNVTDPLLSGTITCRATSLAAGASTTCDAQPYPITQANIDDGKVVNKATAKGTPPQLPVVSADTTLTTPIAAAAALTLSIVATPSTTPLQAGDTISYTFTVTNSGSSSLSGVTVPNAEVAGKALAVTCPPDSVAPKASVTCTGTAPYQVTAADITAGRVTATATAKAKDPNSQEQTSPQATRTTPTAAPAPQIKLTKSVKGVADTNSNGRIDAADVVTYQFVVENVGNVPLQSVYVDDSTLNVTNITCGTGNLAPGATVTCSLVKVPVGQQSIDAGTFDNTATAHAIYRGGSGDQPIDATGTTTLDLSKAGYPATKNALSLAMTHRQVVDEDGSGSVTAGDTVGADLTVTNEGSQTLHDIDVTVPGMGAPVRCAVTLAPGASGTCSILGGHTLSQPEVDSGQYRGTATAKGLSPQNGDVAASEAEATTTIPRSAKLTLTKLAKVDDVATTPQGDSSGDKITYTFTIASTSNVTITNVKLTDVLLGWTDANCGGSTIAPGGSLTCTATYVISSSNIDDRKVVNSATVTGSDPDTVAVSATGNVTTILTPVPAIELTKTHAGGDAPRNVDDVIDYTFTVKNTGAITLEDVRITDARLGIDNEPCFANPLASTATQTCTVTGRYTVSQDDVDGGRVDNSAKVTAQTAADGAVSAIDTDSVPTTDATPRISLVQTAGSVADVDGNGQYSAGDTVAFTFTVTNTGNVSVSSVVIDDALLGLSGFTCSIGSLAPGASTSCTGPPYRLTNADVTDKKVVSTATASAKAARGADPSASDTLTVDLDPSPQITLDKTDTLQDTNQNAKADIGEKIRYGFVVKNTGTSPLTAVTLSDPMLDALTPACDVAGGLAPQDTVTCASADYTVTAADVRAGKVRNAATATGVRAGGTKTTSAQDAVETPTVDASTALRLGMSATLEDTDTDGVADAGEGIVYEFTLTNDGTLPIDDPSVSSSLSVGPALSVTCPTGSVAPGKSVTCSTPKYVVTLADVERANSIVNTATARGASFGGAVTSNEAKATVPLAAAALPQIDLNQTAGAVLDTDRNGQYSVGDTVVFSYEVKNTGSVAVDTVVIENPLFGQVTLSCGSGLLAAGATTTCTSAPYSLTAADIQGKNVVSTATATATTVRGVTATDTDAVNVDLDSAAQLALTKTAALTDANNNSAADFGEIITYTFVVENTGSQPFTAVTLNDPLLGSKTPVCNVGGGLASGASVTCATAEYSVTAADVRAGKVRNEATATGVRVGGTATTSEQVFVETSTVAATATVTLTMTAPLVETNNVGVADAGEVIDYEFTVKNTGTLPIDRPSVSYSLKGAPAVSLACSNTPLAPGASITCPKVPYTVTADDVERFDEIVTTATAKGESFGAVVSSGQEERRTPVAAAAAPQISLVQTPGPVVDVDRNGQYSRGDTVTFTFKVTNTGTVAVGNVVVDDPLLGQVALSCAAGLLAPGASTSCTSAPYALKDADIQAGQVLNEATAKAVTPRGVDVSATNAVTVDLNPAAKVSLQKTANLTDDPNDNKLADVGDTITYGFIVTNIGSQAFTAVTLKDVMLGAKTPACNVGGGLAPGASVTCATAEYTVTAADVRDGKVRNEATATGVRAGGTATTSTPVSVETSTVAKSTALTLRMEATLVDKDGDDLADANEGIVYEFTVKNTGTLPIDKPSVSYSVSGGAVVTVTCSNTPLAPGDSVTCPNVPYTVTAADVLRVSSIVNTATAGGESFGVPIPSSAEQTTRTAVGPAAAPLISLEQSVGPVIDVDGNGQYSRGDTVTFTFEVKNTGPVAVSIVVIDDPALGQVALSCGSGSLASGASTTCTSAPYALKDADITAKKVISTATATATTVRGVQATATDTDGVDLDPAAQLTLTKTADLADDNKNALADVGEKITYTFVVKNTGTLAFTAVTLNDPLLGSGTPACTFTGSLAPQGELTCATAVYTVTAADVRAGKVRNVATATGVRAGGTKTTSDPAVAETTTVAATTALALTMTATDADKDGLAESGEVIDYEFTVKNTGTLPIDNPSVTYSLKGGASASVACPGGPLAPGASLTCPTVSYTVTAADVENLSAIENTATAQGQSGGVAVPPSATAKVSTPVTPAPAPVILLKQTAGAVVDVDGNGAYSPGDTVTFSYTVTNTGPVAVSNVVVDHPLLGQVKLACGSGSVVPQASTTCTSAAYPLTAADVATKRVLSTATATATTIRGVNATSTDTVIVDLDPAAQLTLTKTADLADDNKNAVADVGEKITYSFVVKNTGTQAFTKVTLNDPLLGSANPACAFTGSLAPQDELTCATAVYTVTAADVRAGKVRNVATATGVRVGGTATTSDPAVAETTTVAANATLALTMTATDADKDGLAESGEVIDYEFTVKNTGTLPIDNPSVTYSLKGGASASVTCPGGSLAPGASVTCPKASYTVTAADVENLSTIVSTATARGDSGGSVVTSAPASSTSTPVAPAAAPTISLEQTAGPVVDADGNAQYSPGDTVTFTFKVTNTGPVTVSNVVIDDPLLGQVKLTCGTGSLAPGSSTTCTSAPYPLTAADIAAKQVTSTATATATTARGVEAKATKAVSVDVDPAAQLLLEKTANLQDTNNNALADLGEKITYTFVVTNTGTQPFTAVTLNDPLLGTNTPACAVPGTLPPQGKVTCATADYTVTAGDMRVGKVSNVATAAGRRAGGTITTSEPAKADTNTVPATATMTMTMVATLADTDNDGAADAGEIIDYAFTVTNTGNVPISNVTVNSGLSVTCPSGDLAPGASTTCRATYPVTAADVARGAPIVATATAKADSGGGPVPPTAEARTSTPVASSPSAPGLDLVKTAALSVDRGTTGVADVGDEITYGFVVTNTGVGAIPSVSVSDRMLAAAGIAVTCSGSLAAGSSMRCTAPAYVVTADDIARGGSLRNTATVSGGGATSQPASVTVPVALNAAVALAKSATLSKDAGREGVLDEGDEVEYGLVVTNIGGVVLDSVRLTDPLLSGVTCPADQLAPGASMTCASDPYVVTAADARRGSVSNTASVSGVAGAGAGAFTVRASDTAVIGKADPRLALVKRATLTTDEGQAGAADAGDVIGYSFVVTNTGNATLDTVALADPRLAKVSCPATSLPAGESMTCTGSAYRVTAADVAGAGSIDNTATVTARGPSQQPVSATGAVRVAVASKAVSSLSLTKAVSYGPGADPTRVVAGNALTYVFSVVNTGEVAVQQVHVADQRLTKLGISVDCPATLVAPGQAVTCRADRPYVVTAADADRGSVLNTAAAQAVAIRAPGGPSVEPPNPPTDALEVGVYGGAPTHSPNPGPTPQPPHDPNLPEWLPFTGAAVLPMLALGAGLILAGGALLLKVRRRRR